jgi:uncharacterized membrane protein
MPYCPNCGSQTEGRFCAKCGTAVEAGAGTAAPAAPATPAYTTGPGTGAVAASGLQDNLAGALCYVLGFITGILFLVLEPYNKKPFVRFHAFQSIIFSAAWFALSLAISILFGILGFASGGFMWVLLIPLRLLIGLGGFVLWLFLMFKAYNNERYQLPIVGPMAEKQAAG